MANTDGHRRFGNVRKRESGRYQIRYPGPDGRIRTGPDTYGRKSDADKALVLIEAQMASLGEWSDVPIVARSSSPITPRRGLPSVQNAATADHGSVPMAARSKHIAPYLGGVPVGKLSTADDP